jgi:hypothetical protein
MEPTHQILMPKTKQGVLYYKIPERGNESFYA